MSNLSDETLIQSDKHTNKQPNRDEKYNFRLCVEVIIIDYLTFASNKFG